ncbi:MAG: DegT/DnrJ/EryC1/StrS family aminotransferase [Verrucomicrobiaceae bacterium]|nr:DegT/DnrJ/EryC1/StrS family aminotransferase [Verrucomicrobiaceae bacterium]
MNVPLLDLKTQYKPLREETRKLVDDILDSQYFIGGPYVAKLEEEVAKYSETKAAIGISSGTDALLASLMAIGISPSPLDRSEPAEVILPTYTFFATAGCVWRAGAKPVFVDIDKDTYNIDVDAIEAKITPRTKAIMPVHLYGQCANMEKIREIADKYNLAIIEDGAQAIGARRNGKRVGNFGDCACLSFFPSKNLGGLGDGGMVVTNNLELADKIRQMRNHGMEPKYYHKFVGGNFRLDAIQAAGLLVKLPHLDKWGQMRRSNASQYNEAFAGIDKIKTPFIESQNYSIYNQYIISVENRDEVMNYLRSKNIGCEIYYPVPLHMQECFAGLGYKMGDFPNAEYAATHTIALPIYPELTSEQISYVASSVKEAVAKF